MEQMKQTQMQKEEEKKWDFGLILDRWRSSDLSF